MCYFFRALLDLFGLGPSHFIFFCLSALTFPARINMKINHSTWKHKGLARRIYSKFVWHFNGPIISSFRRRMFAFCSACCLPFWWARAFAVAACYCCCCLYCYLPLFIWLLTRCSFAFNCARVTRCAYVIWQRYALCYENKACRVAHFQLRLFENLASFLLHLAGIRNRS